MGAARGGSEETMLASEIKVCRPRAGGEPGAMLASEKQERSSLNEPQSGWIAPSSAREWIDRSGARCMEIPERCSRVDKQERCSLCGNPEIYSRMETVERSSQVGRVERGREGRKKRVVQQKSTGREGRPKWVAQQKTWGIGTARRARRRWGIKQQERGRRGGRRRLTVTYL